MTVSYWTGVTAAFGAGLGIGAGLWAVLREKQLEEEYRERTASFMRAMEMARTPDVHVHVEAPAETEQNESVPDYVGMVVPEEGIKVGDIEDFKPDSKPDSKNPYHEAVEQPAASWTYLEEEDYADDDGRYKGKITLLPGDDGKPVFVENDIEISDWEQKVGPSILRDFYTMVPPNTHPAVLYVRNNLTESDYEVIRDIP